MLAAALVAAACDGSTGYDVSVRFDPEDLAASAAGVEVALVSDCAAQTLGEPATEARRTVTLRPMMAAGPLGEVAPGDYGLYGRALSSDCLTVAAGCAPVALQAGGSGLLQVTLTAIGGAGCPTGTVCTDGACVGGMDAGMGCAACDDGNPCTEDRCVGDACDNVALDGVPCTDGTCRAGACCTGCWDGTACQAGDGTAACGAAGGDCAGCADTDDCTDDACNAGACANTTRDADGDGHGDPACPEAGGVPADDCDEMAAGTYPGAPEGCNGIDDDCDSVLDEELSCTPGEMGPCTTGCGSTGSSICSDVCLFDTCTPPAETCNSLDDDCDTSVDEDFECIPSSTGACTTSCGSTGSRTCRSTCRWRACSPPAETCNGSDDDCDSSSDETFACRRGATGSCMLGCGESGTRTCDSSCGWGSCNFVAPANTIAMYTFDSEPDRRTLTDIVGPHNGSVTGGDAIWTGGPMGCGMAFSSPTSGTVYGVIPDSPAWDLRVGSLDFWARFPTFTRTQGILSRDAFGTARSGHLTILRSDLGDIYARIQTASGTARRCTATAIPDDTWVHIEVRWGPPDFELLVDGVLATGTVSEWGSCRGTVSAGIDGNDNPWVLLSSSNSSAEGSATPVIETCPGCAIDHLRIRNVR